MARLLSFVLAACAAALPLAAAGIQGTVTVQRTNTPWSEAVVILTSEGERHQTTPDEDGRYVFEGLNSSVSYELSVRAEGFKIMRLGPFRLDAAPILKVNVALELAEVSEAITVAEAAVQLRNDAPEISQAVLSKQLEQLPANGRSLNRFALLDPHVRNTAGLGSDGSSGSRLSINASSFRHTAYALDGTSNYETVFANAPQQSVSLGAVQELNVLTNQYSAEYGTSSAGILVATTKSGTNVFHGEAFGYLRPSGAAAAPPLSPFRVPNERSQWGASAGGPVQKDRTFLFANYEGVHQERGSFIQSPIPGFFTGKLDEFYSLLKIDQQITSKHSLTGRVNANRSENNNVNDRIGAFTQPSAAQFSRSQALAAQVSERAIFSPGFLNEIRLAYTNYVPSSTTPATPQISIVRPNYSTEGGSSSSWVRVQSYQAADVAALDAGRHRVRFGGDYVRTLAKDYSFAPFGEYKFSAGAPTPAQNPQTYTQTFGTAFLRYGQTTASAFVQDDIRLFPRLTANFGLRYEFQSITTDRNNWAPRLGFAFDVFGTGKTTVRGGAGLFYDQYYLYITRRFFLQGLQSPTTTYTVPFGSPGFPVFPNSLPTEPSGLAAGKRDIYLPDRDILNPYGLQYSLGIQQEIGDGWVLTVDAIHTHTLKQMRANDINHPAPFLRTAANQIRSAAQADALRPYQTWDGLPVRNIVVVENSGSSLYDALDVGTTKRFAGGSRVEAHYVYASSANYAMFFGEPNTGIPNEWNDTGRGERAPSDFYQRHRFVANSIISMPWRTEFSTIATVSSGMPVNPLTGNDNNGDTYGFDRPVGFGRNTFRTPLQAALDASISKRIKLHERLAAEIRLDAFNVFNRNNYVKVNAVYGEGPSPKSTFLNPLAGVSNVDPSRQLQVALRLTF